MSKQDEKKAFQSFIDSLPFDSYLFSIMTTIQKHVEDQIDSDFGFVDWSLIQGEQLAHRQAMSKAKEELQIILDQKRDLERMILKHEDSLRAITSEAQRIAGDGKGILGVDRRQSNYFLPR